MALCIVLVAGAALCLTMGVTVIAGDGIGGLAAIAPAISPARPSAAAAARLPPEMLGLYERAAPACPGLPWTVLAAIGTVESSNGTSDLPGVHSGSNFAGAQGPMQFEPTTFAEYDEPVPPGGADPPSPYDPVDAVFAAARLLCANGAAGGRDIAEAVYAYNHSESYVSEVMSLAQSFAAGGS